MIHDGYPDSLHPQTTLESRFLDLDQPIFLSGIQALVRVLLEQSRLDRAAGHRTAALVSWLPRAPLGAPRPGPRDMAQAKTARRARHPLPSPA